MPNSRESITKIIIMKRAKSMAMVPPPIIGMGAYENMKTRNIRPVVTDIADIDEAIMAYANGQIVDHIEKLN